MASLQQRKFSPSEKTKSGRSPAPTPQPSKPEKASKSVDYKSEGVEDNDVFLLPGSDFQILGVLTVVAAVVRLFRIYQPSSVVFDEVQYVFLTRDSKSCVLTRLQLRRICFEIHQGQILHGRPPSPC